MITRKPPRIATWLIEHSALAHRDDALAGDLLEEFRTGRSNRWYWQQAFAALVIGWTKELSRRGPILLFALLWSAFVPAWAVLLDGLLNRRDFREQVSRMDWVFMGVPQLGVWYVGSLVFLFAGLLLFYLASTRIKSRMAPRQLGGSFLRAFLLFVPIYFATFVVIHLLASPGAAIARHPVSAMTELIDVRAWAIALRVPYFLTVLVALWPARPLVVAGAPSLPVSSGPEIPSTQLPAQSNDLLFQNKLDEVSTTALLRILVVAGLVNSLIVAILLCRLPASHGPSFSTLAERAVIYVILGGFAGAGAQWWYWRRASNLGSQLPTSFNLFSLTCASVWIWVPAIVILAAQDASMCLAPAAAVSALFAASLRRIVPETEGTPSFDAYNDGQTELFAQTLRQVPFDYAGFVIAIAVVAVPYALHLQAFLLAAGLSALATFQFAWKKTIAPCQWGQPRNATRRAAWRLAWMVLPAFLITLWSLLDGVEHRNRTDLAITAQGAHGSQQRSAVGPRVAVIDGYESVILWPMQPKHQIVAPVPALINPFALRGRKPLIIPFDGPYWYFQAPEKRPGPQAHQAHGSPLSTTIKAANLRPLEIEAHQRLGVRVPVSLCREIVVDVANQDSNSGAIALGIQLKDSRSQKNSTIELGPQAIRIENAVKSNGETASSDAIRFLLPLRARLRSFDEITVGIFTDRKHSVLGPKIAIQRFEIVPR